MNRSSTIFAVARGCSPDRWQLWTQRRRLIVYCLVIDVAALGCGLLALGGGTVHGRDAALFAALVGLGVLQAELARQMERARRRFNATPHINMSSVWTFAGALLLPAVLLLPLVAVLYLHLATRSWYRLRRAPAFRSIFNAGLVTLTCFAAHYAVALAGHQSTRHALQHGWPGMSLILFGAAVYFVVGAVIAIPGLSVELPTWAAFLGSWSDNALEATTIGLGAVTAVLLLDMPGLSVTMVPCLLLIQRGVVVKELEVVASTDEKTGLLNPLGWHRAAAEEFRRASGKSSASLGVLMIDLDHFKRVNDEYGHLVGDLVLRAVAETITAEVRGADSVGRFGGEEFVVLLPNSAPPDVVAVAERVRRAVAALAVPAGGTHPLSGLSVSIGVAMYPAAGTDIDVLLQVADTALYSAKGQGRNRVAHLAG